MPQSNERNWRHRYRGTNDISMRHNGTFVGKRNSNGEIIPFYCSGVSGSNSNPTLVVRRMSRMARDSTEIALNAPDLVISKPELGMCNLKCEISGKTLARWVAGMPRRQIKLSLSMNIMDFQELNLGHYMFILHPSTSRDRGNGRENLESALKSWFNNSYPTLGNALHMMQTGEALSVAFSRKFALGFVSTGAIGLFYKTNLVGYLDENDQPQLFEYNVFLQEALEEELC